MYGKPGFPYVIGAGKTCLNAESLGPSGDANEQGEGEDKGPGAGENKAKAKVIPFLLLLIPLNLTASHPLSLKLILSIIYITPPG